MKLLRILTDLFVFGNLYVAIPVTCLAWESYLLAGVSVSAVLLGFVYASTLLLYTTHRFVGVTAMLVAPAAQRHEWANRNKATMAVIIGLSAGASFVFFSMLKTPWLQPLLVAAAMAGLYALPIIPTKGGFKRLRDVPGIKIYFIVAAVTLVTLQWPLGAAVLSFTDWCFLTVARVLFLLAITIPFDIRDMEADAGAKLATIPLQLGEQKSVRLSLVLVSAFALVSAIHFAVSPTIGWPMLLALELSAVFTALIIWQVRATRSEYFFSLLVEGTMIVQFAFVWFLTA